jgi:hypothetical protein
MILGLVMYLLVKDTGNIHAQCLNNMLTLSLNRSIEGPQHKFTFTIKLTTQVYNYIILGVLVHYTLYDFRTP